VICRALEELPNDLDPPAASHGPPGQDLPCGGL
jgi:hypothetical protein